MWKPHCRFLRKKMGEGYPPLPGPQEQMLLKALNAARILVLESSSLKAFEKETGFSRPGAPDAKFDRSIRDNAYTEWKRKKLREIDTVMEEYSVNEK